MVHHNPFVIGEKVQLTDKKNKKFTIQLTQHGTTVTDRGIIVHDHIIGRTPGIIIATISSQEWQQIRQDSSDNVPTTPQQRPESTDRMKRRSAVAQRSVSGWSYTVLRPRMVDYVLSMPRGAQIMYPKDIAQVIALADIRSGNAVLESGAGSGAMSLAILEAVGAAGSLVTIERNPEFAEIAQGNAELYFGYAPQQWDVRVGDFDAVAPELSTNTFDAIVLDMLDPWNRLDEAYRVIAPGGVLVAYVTTTTQLSRLAERLRDMQCWTEPEITETMERQWKVQGLAIRPEHQMIGHTGFLLWTRAMAEGYQALQKRERVTKDTYTDIDTENKRDTCEVNEERELQSLELRDMSDRKLRKVLRDLGQQQKILRDSQNMSENRNV